MKRIARHLTLAAALLGSSFAYAVDLRNYDAYYDAPALQTVAPSHAARDARAFGIVTSVDEQTGVPSWVWGAKELKQVLPLQPGISAERAALLYIEKLAPLYRLSKAAIGTAYVKHVHDIGRGAIIVSMGQSVGGIDVFLTEMNVVMNRNLELVAIGGSLHEMGVPSLKGSDTDYLISPNQALVNAFEDLYGISLKPTSVRDTKMQKGGAHYFDFVQTPEVAATQMHFVEPARIKRMFFPMPDKLVAAYWVEFFSGKIDSTTSDAYAYVIAADDGRVLSRTNLTYSFNYRVWADATGDKRPLDGPQADWTPHPAGMPTGAQPPYIKPVMVTIDGFNTNPQGTFDPWLAAGATETRGNNVDAYTDWSGSDGYQGGVDYRAVTTAADTFSYTYDTATEPLATLTQSRASVTQLFYVTNWLHDWWYDSGFNESAGNAQEDNFGRGGQAGDSLRAEAQDGAKANPPQANNANMSTGSDGTDPRMQMYVWSGPSPATVTMNGMAYGAGTASFGPQAFPPPPSSGPTIIANPPQACTPITNNVSGQIVIIDRGPPNSNCTFVLKTQHAETAGAIGVILVNNVSGNPPQMGAMNPNPNPTIPILSVTQADGNYMKTLVPAMATLQRSAAIGRDGTIDNHIVAHEWGHYIHLRQVGGGSQQIGAMSEGWGDFTALHMAVRPGDDLSGTYAAAVYAPAILGDSAFFGIRRVAYSSDMTKNCLTFRHVGDSQTLPNTCPINNVGSQQNSEVHNAGEVWAQMVFESYISLLNAHSSDIPGGQRLMTDYVQGGYQAAPPNPSFTEQRDAILATAAAADPQDLLTLAQGFAKRGAGTCAVSPPKSSSSLDGVVEDFMVRPALGPITVTVDDSLVSCDNDGVLDGEERGYINISVQNTGVELLDNTQISVTTTTPGITFPNGTMTTLASVAPFATGVAQIEIQADNSFAQITPMPLNISLNNPAACMTTSTINPTININVDIAPMSSATETAESDIPVWTADQGMAGYDAWRREAGMPGNTLWHGDDVGSPADPSLVSPPLDVSATQSFVLTMTHRHQFEFGQGINWDGGVIEISTDNGSTWNDIEMYGQAPYNGLIGDGAGGASNVLDNRQGFVDNNPAWPSTDTISIDMGTSLAGQTVLVRFRIGCDDAAGEQGWFIDDIGFQGITNTPFTSIGPDAACGSGTGGASTTGGSSTGGDGSGPPAGVEGGCGCSTVGNSSASLSPLAALALLALRRRRRSEDRSRASRPS